MACGCAEGCGFCDAAPQESLAQDRVKEDALRKAREEAAKAAEARLRREADAKAAAEAEALKEAERAASARADLEKLAKDLQVGASDFRNVVH
jgi:hypothetical protein